MEIFIEKSLAPYISANSSTLAKDSVFENEHLKAAEEILLDKGLEDYTDVYKTEKSEIHCAEHKESAIDLIKRGKYFGAICDYNAILCYAPPGSESIGIAYANRSVVYMQLGYYKLALENIQLARKYNYPEAKLEKLAQREERCMQKIREGASQDDSYQGHKDAREMFLKPTLPANPKFPFYMANCLTIKKSKKFGPHIRTTENLEVGTIVAVERPLVATLEPKYFAERCQFCRSRLLFTGELFSCDSCSRVLYCSINCKIEAEKRFHKIICSGENIFGKSDALVLKLFCAGLSCFQKASDFTEFLQKIENSEDMMWDEDLTGLNEKEVNKKIIQVLISYKPNIQPKKDPELTATFKKLALFIATTLNFTNLKEILTTEDDKNMFRRFVQNQFEAYTNLNMEIEEWSRYTDENRIGFGSLAVFPYLKHCCTPNIRGFYSGSDFKFIVLRPIKKGGQLFMARDEMATLSLPVEMRRYNLWQRYKFWCECDTCISDAQRGFSFMASIDNESPASIQRFMANNKDYRKIEDYDLPAAVQHFPIICRYLQENDAHYPCFDIKFMQPLFEKCIMTFNLNDRYM